MTQHHYKAERPADRRSISVTVEHRVEPRDLLWGNAVLVKREGSRVSVGGTRLFPDQIDGLIAALIDLRDNYPTEVWESQSPVTPTTGTTTKAVFL